MKQTVTGIEILGLFVSKCVNPPTVDPETRQWLNTVIVFNLGIQKGLNGGILVLGSLLPPGVQNEYELFSKIFLKSKRNFRRY